MQASQGSIKTKPENEERPKQRQRVQKPHSEKVTKEKSVPRAKTDTPKGKTSDRVDDSRAKANTPKEKINPPTPTQNSNNNAAKSNEKRDFKNKEHRNE